MSQNSNQTVTTETLKALTNAPSLDEPLVSQDAFKDGEVHSARPIWKTPVVKLTVIGAALVPIFGLAGYFLVGGKQLDQPERAQNPSQTGVTDPEPDLTLAEELEQLRQESGFES